MSVSCKGCCEINKEEIDFVPLRQVRYSLGMKYCCKCEKGWVTDDIICHCCHCRLRSNRKYSS